MTTNLEQSPLMDYSDFKKLYESKLFEEADMDELVKKIEAAAAKIDISDSDVKTEVKKTAGVDIDKADLRMEEPVNEALLTIAGAVLSAGKLAEWLGKGVSWVGKKLDTKGIENVGSWLEKGGHKYTKAIEEKIVLPALKLIPSFNKLSDDHQKSIAKYVLIGVIGTLGISAGFSLINAIKDGHGLMAAVETALVGAKGSEISNLVGEVIGDVVKGTSHAA